MQNSEFWRQYLRFIDVLYSKVISIAKNALMFKKIQVEENISAFNTIFGININGVKFQIITERCQRIIFLNLIQEFCTQQISFNRNFTFIGHVLTVYY